MIPKRPTDQARLAVGKGQVMGALAAQVRHAVEGSEKTQ